MEMKFRMQRFSKCVMCIYHRSDQNILSLHVVSESIKFETFRNIILPLVVRGSENYSLTLREGCC
jgi:hypothetical protein